ncbi:MAG TPA: maleylpyruvate isomerase family mycothiol-dependent enzyme [Streptosporangiaceae bacterium]
MGMTMNAPGDNQPGNQSHDRFFAELRACTAELARIVEGDLDRPVPTCPGWTFRQLAIHLGRGHRWAAQIVATRATAPVAMREVADGKLPEDPARHAPWLNQGADQVIEAVTAVGSDPVWTMTGMRPASFWARRRAHEAAVHMADAQLAIGREVDLAPEFAADGVDEWLALLTEGTSEPDRARVRELGGEGQSLHFHATDPGLTGTGEWQIRRTASGITVEHGHGKADLAVRGPATSLLLVLTRRLPASDPSIEVFGDQALLTHWLEHTPF